MQRKIAVVGLGYVGLPVAVAFARAPLAQASAPEVVGFDIDASRIGELCRGVDRTGEIEPGGLPATGLRFTDQASDLRACDFFIVAVPTPVDAAHKPDLAPLISASRTVGPALKPGDIVVFESTVYPGATEEDCVPVLEATSGLKHGVDFFCGYSPERINPGDREHRFEDIRKIVSGCDAATLETVARVYESVVRAGVHRASSIRVAEAAKVIENTQRDLNIALMNELSVIFARLGIDTAEVLAAAGSKWNFLPFRPGLVGGHCIGVDPYYLTYKAEQVGYIPQVILAGRRINDSMGKFIAEQTIKQMIASGSAIKGAKVNVLGLTFKENCGDLRNSKVIDIIRELQSYGVAVFVTDAQAEADEALHEYGVELLPFDALPQADAVVAAVSHREYAALTVADIGRRLVRGGAFIDVKAAFDAQALTAAGFRLWRL